MGVRTVDVPDCPVCGETGGEILHEGLTDRIVAVSPGEWRLRCCARCGAARLDPRPADDEIPGLYARYLTHAPPLVADPAPSGLGRVLRALRNGYLNERLGYRLSPAWRVGAIAGRLAPPLGAAVEQGVRSLPLGDRLLDVGAGNGGFVAAAAAAGWRAQGIDIDDRAVAAARGAGLDVTAETVEVRARREPAAYDAVTLGHVLEHVPRPVEFLRATRELMRAGGRLWVATPNLRALGHRRYGKAWLGLDPPRHMVLFDERSALLALEAAGFGDVRFLPSRWPAATTHPLSAAVRAGRRPALGSPLRSPAVRARALIDDARAQLDRSRSEELCLLARAV